MNSFKSVLEKSEHLIEVKHSKFIGIIFPCKSIQDFEAELDRIKKEHSGANHYCYAYRIQEHVLLERYQDDKEPSGTAGMPILDVLKGHELNQCALVVVRYFGGTKLGTGGLSRAYSEAAREVLTIANMGIMEEACYISVEVDYHFNGKIEYFLNTNNIALMDTQYANHVTYLIARPWQYYEEFLKDIEEITSGQGKVVLQKKVLGYFKGNQFVEN